MDVTVQAFRKLDLPLKVVGSGRDLESLRRLAGPKTEFLGHVSDAEVRDLYNRCRAFIQAGSEDFGITPIEAMGGGAPVLAINRDGPAETIIAGKTGLFFEEQTPQALAQAVRRFEQVRTTFDPDAIRSYAETFDLAVFQHRFQDYVGTKWEQFQAQRPDQQLVAVS